MILEVFGHGALSASFGVITSHTSVVEFPAVILVNIGSQTCYNTPLYSMGHEKVALVRSIAKIEKLIQ